MTDDPVGLNEAHIPDSFGSGTVFDPEVEIVFEAEQPRDQHIPSAEPRGTDSRT